MSGPDPFNPQKPPTPKAGDCRAGFVLVRSGIRPAGRSFAGAAGFPGTAGFAGSRFSGSAGPGTCRGLRCLSRGWCPLPLCLLRLSSVPVRGALSGPGPAVQSWGGAAAGCPAAVPAGSSGAVPAAVPAVSAAGSGRACGRCPAGLRKGDRVPAGGVAVRALRGGRRQLCPALAGCITSVCGAGRRAAPGEGAGLRGCV